MKEQCKPLLAKLQEDFPKIKNENVQVIDGTINYLFALLNIQFKPEERLYRDTQTLVLSEFLQDRFKHLTLEEVKQAFKMYAAKEFPELKTFRILDCITLGEVLNAYVERRNQNLHVYNQKLLANKQNSIDFNPSVEQKARLRKEHLLMIFESLKSNKTDYTAFIYFKEIKDKISMSDEQREDLYKYEALKYKKELESESLENSFKRTNLTEFIRESSAGKRNPIVQDRCRASVVCDYLKRHLESFETFINALEN